MRCKVQIPDIRRYLSAFGFTMVEIIAVLVIISVIAAVVVSRVTGARGDDTAAANTLKAHLRYAQLRAMGDTEAWGIDIDGNTYTLMKGNEPAPVNLPGEGGPSKTLENIIIDNTTIMFEAALGRPDPNGTEVGVGNRHIAISPETGFIE